MRMVRFGGCFKAAMRFGGGGDDRDAGPVVGGAGAEIPAVEMGAEQDDFVWVSLP